MLPHRLPTQENGFALREGCWTIARALRATRATRPRSSGRCISHPCTRGTGSTPCACASTYTCRSSGRSARRATTASTTTTTGSSATAYEDWRFVDGKPVQSSPGAYRFPYAADAHPTNWIEREARAVLDARDREPAVVARRFLPSPARAVQPVRRRTPRCTTPEDSRLPASGAEANAALPMVFQLAAEMSRERTGEPDEVQLRAFSAVQRALVKQIDDAVGRLLDALDFDTDRRVLHVRSRRLRRQPRLAAQDADVPVRRPGAGSVLRLGRGPWPAGTASIRSCRAATSPSPVSIWRESRLPKTPCSTAQSLRPLLQDRAAVLDRERAGFQRNVIAHGDGPARRVQVHPACFSRTRKCCSTSPTDPGETSRSRPTTGVPIAARRPGRDAARDARSSGRPRLTVDDDISYPAPPCRSNRCSYTPTSTCRRPTASTRTASASPCTTGAATARRCCSRTRPASTVGSGRRSPSGSSGAGATSGRSTSAATATATRPASTTTSYSWHGFADDALAVTRPSRPRGRRRPARVRALEGRRRAAPRRSSSARARIARIWAYEPIMFPQPRRRCRDRTTSFGDGDACGAPDASQRVAVDRGRVRRVRIEATART